MKLEKIFTEIQVVSHKSLMLLVRDSTLTDALILQYAALLRNTWVIRSENLEISSEAKQIRNAVLVKIFEDGKIHLSDIYARFNSKRAIKNIVKGLCTRTIDGWELKGFDENAICDGNTEMQSNEYWESLKSN